MQVAGIESEEDDSEEASIAPTPAGSPPAAKIPRIAENENADGFQATVERKPSVQDDNESTATLSADEDMKPVTVKYEDQHGFQYMGSDSTKRAIAAATGAGGSLNPSALPLCKKLPTSPYKPKASIVWRSEFERQAKQQQQQQQQSESMKEIIDSAITKNVVEIEKQMQTNQQTSVIVSMPGKVSGQMKIDPSAEISSTIETAKFGSITYGTPLRPIAPGETGFSTSVPVSAAVSAVRPASTEAPRLSHQQVAGGQQLHRTSVTPSVPAVPSTQERDHAAAAAMYFQARQMGYPEEVARYYYHTLLQQSLANSAVPATSTIGASAIGTARHGSIDSLAGNRQMVAGMHQLAPQPTSTAGSSSSSSSAISERDIMAMNLSREYMLAQQQQAAAAFVLQDALNAQMQQQQQMHAALAAADHHRRIVAAHQQRMQQEYQIQVRKSASIARKLGSRGGAGTGELEDEVQVDILYTLLIPL